MWWIDQILLLGICVPLQILVIVGVSDTIRLVDKYAQLFSPTEPSRWPPDVLARLGRTIGMASDLPDTPGVDIRDRALRSWPDMQVIAKWSHAASHLIYWPFGLLGLILVARSPVFDNWETP